MAKASPLTRRQSERRSWCVSRGAHAPVVHSSAGLGAPSDNQAASIRDRALCRLDLRRDRGHVVDVLALGDGGQKYVKPYPKSAAGRRSVTLPRLLVE
jgi:hypothetical protein